MGTFITGTARCALSFLAAALIALPAHAQALPDGSAARLLASIMAARHAAQELAGPGADRQALEQAAARLEQLRKQLDEPPYRDAVPGDSYLYAERLNIGIPLAQIHARLGEKDKALQALEATTSVVLVPGLAMLAEDPGLASLRKEPRFQAVMATYRQGAIASSKSFATPFSATLTRRQRIAGLSHFWSEVRHNFANVDLMPALDWDALYMAYLDKVMEAKTTAAYYRVLMQLAPLLQDGHTNIYPPGELASLFFARPPVDTELVEDVVVVRAVHDRRLARSISVGDEIVAVDGMPVKAYAERFVRPFVSSSTPQDRHVRMYSYQLLAGDAKRPVALTIRDGKGRLRRMTVARSGSDRSAENAFPFHVSDDGIAYLRLDHFESDAGVKAFEQALPEIRRAKGLILDVRRNGGGSTDHGLRILSYLMDKPVEPMRGRVRFEDQSFRAQAGDSVSWRPLAAPAPLPGLPAGQRFDGPVAVLIGPKTFSAAEDFAAMYAQAGRGILVGEATGGSTGQALVLGLPGGGQARICVKRDSFADGSDFVGKGIAPDYTVRDAIAAVRSGADPVRGEAHKLLLAGAEAQMTRRAK